jgi:hypothetical protein
VDLDLLLWVVSRVCEYARVEATFDVIKAVDYDSMLVCLEKIIIKDNSPLSVIQLSVAMCHENAVWSFPTNKFLREGFECVWELLCMRVEPTLIANSKSLHSQIQSRQCVQMPGRTVLIFYLWTHSLCQDRLVIV